MKMSLPMLLALLTTACATGEGWKVPLKPVSYDASPTVQTEKSLSISFASGEISGAKAPAPDSVGDIILWPVTHDSMEPFQFDDEDQRLFVEYLEAELERLGIVRIVQPDKDADLAMHLVFEKTMHIPNENTYRLDVILEIKSAGNSYQKRYQIDSCDGCSSWDKINRSVAKGKKIAASKLMAEIVPDVEEVLREWHTL